MLSLPPLTPAFAAQAPAFLQNTAEWMQSAFFVQQFGQPYNRATHTALSVAALTHYRERVLGCLFYYEKREGPMTPELRLNHVYKVSKQFFSGLPESEIPAYEALLPELARLDRPDHARDVLDYGAAVMVRGLQVVHQDAWPDALAHLSMETYPHVAAALATFEDFDAAKALLVRAPKLGLRYCNWMYGFGKIRDELKRLGATEEAAEIDREIEAIEQRRRLPAAPSAFAGGSGIPCSDNGFRWAGLLGDIAAAYSGGK